MTSNLLSKPEGYEEPSFDMESSEVVNNEHIRPQTSSSISNGAQQNFRPNSSQNTSFIGQFIQNGNQNGNGNQRHAISPICCEVIPIIE